MESPSFATAHRIKGFAAVERVYMAAMEFRAITGRFPKTLKEAGHEVQDPVYGGPLTYRLAPQGFVVSTPGLVFEREDPSTGETKKSIRKSSALPTHVNVTAAPQISQLKKI